MISSSKAVVIAQLVILARKNPGTSPLHILFSHDKDPFDGINKLDVQDTTLESFYFLTVLMTVRDIVKAISVETD